MTKLVAPLELRLADADTDRVARNIRERIRELQARPAMAMEVISEVTLVDGVDTPIAHGLGRKPRLVTTSVPRGATAAGVITEVRTKPEVDRTRYVVLRADDFGATITVDLVVL